MTAEFPLGAHIRDDGSTSFCVWAPGVDRVQLDVRGGHGPRLMQRDGSGYHTLIIDGADQHDYCFHLDSGRVLPDPASRHQPDGVHGLSRVVPTGFDWQTHNWPQPDLDTLVLYELHVGTFTSAGTFDAARAHLPALRDLGVTAIELMPVAQFPGVRNWGYDGVYPFAVQHSYGGPLGLKRFVDAAHSLGLAVALDVVYNHLGPEGNYLASYGPYFTNTYTTPWGQALNFDGADSDHVRRHFIESALQWVDEYRIDALRIDAVHAIFDASAQPFLRELTAAVHSRGAALDRHAIVIAESDLGDPRVVRPADRGGLGMDGQWLDDFHHSLRTLLTDERTGYYMDFGQLDHFARSLQHGYVYTGQYSRYRRRRHGAPASDVQPPRFVVYTQNHDHVGNRVAGDRPSAGLTAAQLRLMAAAVLLSPFTPMLFMGEEYGELNPFPYFVSHGDPDLVEAVRSGRREEFAAFAWQDEPPDPQSVETFRAAVLDWSLREAAGHRELLALYTRLTGLRSHSPALRAGTARNVTMFDGAGQPSSGQSRDGVVLLRRDTPQQASLLFLNFAAAPVTITSDNHAGPWRLVLDTEEAGWGGSGSMLPTHFPPDVQLAVAVPAHAAVLLMRETGDA